MVENERRASGYIASFIAQTTKLANCKSGATCPDGGPALNKLNAKGVELNNWMNGLIVPSRPGTGSGGGHAPRLTHPRTGGHCGRLMIESAASLTACPGSN